MVCVCSTERKSSSTFLTIRNIHLFSDPGGKKAILALNQTAQRLQAGSSQTRLVTSADVTDNLEEGEIPSEEDNSLVEPSSKRKRTNDKRKVTHSSRSARRHRHNDSQ